MTPHQEHTQLRERAERADRKVIELSDLLTTTQQHLSMVVDSRSKWIDACDKRREEAAEWRSSFEVSQENNQYLSEVNRKLRRGSTILFIISVLSSIWASLSHSLF